MDFFYAIGAFFFLLALSLKENAAIFIGVTVAATIIGGVIAAASAGAILSGALWAGGLAAGGMMLFNIGRVTRLLLW